MSTTSFSPQFNFATIENNWQALLESYSQNGIIYLKNFLDQSACNAVLNELAIIQKAAEKDIQKNWADKKIYFYSKNPATSRVEKNDYAIEPYFLQSGDKGHVFYEMEQRENRVNRIGHGMHLNQEYRALHSMIYKNKLFNNLLKALAYKKPICHLSVYIPKYPNGIGSEVNPHQESTFVSTEPHSTAVLWVALEKATIENACMWGILGSHKWPLKYLSQVNPTERTRTFKKINAIHIPNFSTERDNFTPLAVNAGDALFFHGNFVHLSPINASDQSRKALSFQFIETAETHYLSTNWLQPRNNKYLYGK